MQLKMRQYIKNNYKALFHKSNVVGIGTGFKRTKGVVSTNLSMLFFVEKKVSKSQLSDDDFIPPFINDMPTDIVETGPFTKQLALPTAIDSDPQLLNRIRPVLGGFSVGQVDVTAGTIATFAYDPVQGPSPNYYLLSTNSILANENRAPIGSPILQPAPFDGGTPDTDTVALLSRFIPIQFSTDTDSPVNYVDCALGIGNLSMLGKEVYWQGYIDTVASSITVGEAVQMTARTAGYTNGTVMSTDAMVMVGYDTGIALFEDQIVTTLVGLPGDAGGLLLNSNKEALGMLFAGSPTSNLFNKIGTVLSFLNVKLGLK